VSYSQSAGAIRVRFCASFPEVQPGVAWIRWIHLPSRSDHPVAITDRLVDRLVHHTRHTALFFEAHRFEDNMARHAFEFEGEDQPARPEDLVIYTVEGELVPSGIALDEAPLAARLQVHLVDVRSQIAGAPPLRDQLWVADCLEYDFAGCLECACDKRRMASIFGRARRWVECVRILTVNGPVLVLASNSPRRRELLALSGWLFHSRPAEVDESLRSGEAPATYVLRLAESKARACLRQYRTVRAALAYPPGQSNTGGTPVRDGRYRCISTDAVAESAQAEQAILAADTAVVSGQAILGKPKDQAEAVVMLRSLRGRSHQVLTGLTVMRMNDRTLVTDLCVTTVPMRSYSDDEIDAYVASGDPLDKAGGYAIQHLGFHPVECLSGCYASVMGLPLCHLARSLRKLGFTSNADIAAKCQNTLGYTCPISSAVLHGEMVG
jgi:septum formation protein